MKQSLIRQTASLVRREIRQAREEGKGDPRLIARAVAARLAEVGVNLFFPTNGSGNNMSRG